jgi:tetratricopeptide (TPR) repeat protein
VLDTHTEAKALQAEGRHEEALSSFERAAQYFAATEEAPSPNLAYILTDWSQSLLALCRYAEAEEKARRGKEILNGIRHLLDPAIAGSMLPLALAVWGRSLRELGRYDDAASALLDAVREAEQCFGKDALEIVGFLNEYGVLCKYWGRFDEGEVYYLSALHIVEERLGKESPVTASLYHNLGGLEHTRGDFAKGEPLARMAYEIRRRALGEDHADTMADAVAWGGLLDGLGRYEESVPVYRRALEFYEQRFGPDHFEVAATLNNLGMAVLRRVGMSRHLVSSSRQLRSSPSVRTARCAGCRRELL